MTRTTELTIDRNGFLVLLGIGFFIAGLHGVNVAYQYLLLLAAFGTCVGISHTMKVNLQALSELKAKKRVDTTEVAALVPSPERPIVYTLRVPKGKKWNPQSAYQWMLKCIVHPYLVFRIEATAASIMFQIVDLSLSRDDGVIQSAVHAVYPDAEVQAALYQPATFEGSYFRATYEFQQTDKFYRPIQYARDLKEFDPLVMLTNLMEGLHHGERLSYNVFVGHIDNTAHRIAEQEITKQRVFLPGDFLSPASWMVSIGASAFAGRQDKYVADGMRVFREKIQEVLFETRVLVQVDTPVQERLPHFEVATPMLRYSTYYQGFLPTGGNSTALVSGILTNQSTSDIAVMSEWVDAKARKGEKRNLFNPHELAALWHMPHEGFTSYQLEWAEHRAFVPMPMALRGVRDGVYLGENRNGNFSQEVYLSASDRTMHTYILGKTGTGKSTLMQNMIRQDIEAGYGVAVIDPKGDLVRSILETSIPSHRESDVVYLDFSNEANPPPLNLLRVPEGADKAEAVGRLMTIFETLEEDFKGQMADTLYNALLTLVEEDTPTLRDVSRLFRDPDYRRHLLERLDNHAAEDFWASFNLLTFDEQQKRAQPVEHRLRTFYRNKLLEPILCHPDHLDFGHILHQGKILLVSFSLDTSNGRIPPIEQRLLGAVLIQQLQIATMSTNVLPKPFYLYVDETQHFVTTPLHQLFSEARSRNLGLILANQYLKQLAGDTIDAVLGNVGATITFEIEENNARQLQPYYRPNFNADDLVSQGTYQAAIRMRSHGKYVPAFSLSTCPPPKAASPVPGRATEIIAQSVEGYTPKSRQEVLDWLSARYPKPVMRGEKPADDATWYDKG